MLQRLGEIAERVSYRSVQISASAEVSEEAIARNMQALRQHLSASGVGRKNS